MYSELHVFPDSYNRPFPKFSRPKIIGYLSLDSERHYQADTRQLKFAKCVESKSVSYDLNLQIEKTKRKREGLNEKISHLLQFLMDQEKRLNFPVANEMESARFFCYRGLLTCVACTPYENNEPWRIVATLHRGNIYLCALDTQEKIERVSKMTDKEKRFTTWGYKFEQFILSDDPHSDPQPEEPLNENEEFSLVFATNVNRHTIIYGAEMDGIRCDKGKVEKPPSAELGPDATIQYLADKQFIELKTNRHIEFPNQHNNFRRYKTKKWWCQSFLAGVDTIVCGFRNDSGTVEELKVFDITELPKLSQRFWKPNICLNFLDTFLTYVKRCLSKEIKKLYGEKSLKNLKPLPRVSLHFEWNPRMPVRVTDTYSYEADPILPEWFVNKCGVS